MSNAAKDAVAEALPSTEELKEDVKKATKSSVQSLRALVAGGVGGVCAVVVGHPFDLVKVRLQTAEKGVYTGAMDVVRKTVAREGLARGLYAGVSAPLVGVTPMCKYCSLDHVFLGTPEQSTDHSQSLFRFGDTILASSSCQVSQRSRTINSASPKCPPPASSALYP